MAIANTMIFSLLQLLFILHQTSSDFPLTCPSKPHWNFRAKMVCNDTIVYRCLWDANYHRFLEQCAEYYEQRKGFRKVIEGDITAGDCTANTYQPRKWITKGNFDCEFQKSLCNDEGQIIYEDGGGITDRTCGCNHTAGYAFLNKPKNLCYCVPSEEDCTCIKKKCRLHQKVDPEYQCRSIFRWKSWFSCPITPCESIKKACQEKRIDKTDEPVQLINYMGNVPKKAINFKSKAVGVVVTGIVLIVILGVSGILLYTVFSEQETKNQVNVVLVKIQSLEQKIDEIEAFKKNIKKPEALCRRNERYKMHIKTWKKDEETFYVTKATKHVADLIEKNDIVVVTGCSGSGKSSLIHHVALKLETHGYDLIPYVTSPNDIIQYRFNIRDQLFVIEDLCGKKFIDKIDLNIWKKQSDKIKKIFPCKNSIQGRLKILVSCRLNIFEDDTFKSLSLFTKEVVDLQSEDYRLRADEKLAMLRMYISIADDDWKKINGKMKYCPFFPLLCKMSKGKTVDQLKDLVSFPIDCMRKDIRQMVKLKPEENCALAMSLLFPDDFHEDITDYTKIPVEFQKKVFAITDFYKIKLASETEGAKLRKALARLDGTYIKKTGKRYSISHDKLYDIVAVECSDGVDEFYLKHAPSTLLSEHYRFSSVPEKEDPEVQLFINVKESDENLYFRRMFEDLHEKSYKSFFNNQQLKEETFRDKFMNFIEENKDACDTRFSRLDRNGMSELSTEDLFYKSLYVDTYTTTPLIEATKIGFCRLVNHLLSINCNAHKKDSYNKSPLWYSLEYGFVEIFGSFLKQGVGYYDELVNACNYGMIRAVKMVVNRQLDVSKWDRNGDTPLTVACKSGQEEAVGLLLKGGAPLSGPDKFGWTPLLWACRRGHHKIVDILIRRGADVSQKDKHGVTPLMAACDGSHIEVVKQLLHKNACVDHADSLGKKALDYTSDDKIKMILRNPKKITEA